MDTTTAPADITGLTTLQFHVGGLVDSEPLGQIHLVRSTGRGTPGPTLCDLDRFAKDAPGWSVGGGVDGPSYRHEPCQTCATAARSDFAGLPISGMFKALFAS